MGGSWDGTHRNADKTRAGRQEGGRERRRTHRRVRRLQRHLWLWDLRDSAAPASIGRGPAEVYDLALTADGRTLGVATDSGTQLWDVRARRSLGKPLPGGAFSLAFTPDGRSLVIDEASVVRIWNGIFWSDLNDLRSQVCNLVAGDLTRAEWQAIAPDLPYRTIC